MNIHVLPHPMILWAMLSGDTNRSGDAVRCQISFSRHFRALNENGIRLEERLGHLDVTIVFRQERRRF